MAELYTDYRHKIDNVLADVGKFLGDLVEAPQGEAAHDANALIDGHLQQFFKAYYDLKSRHDDSALSVAVLALTKSGKSTLLNALLGAECLPVNNVPETARICKIVHTPLSEGTQPTMHEGDTVYDGEQAIRQRLQEINSEVRSREHQATDENILHIHAPFSALESIQNDADHHRLFLLDTPGPNEAGEEGLRYQVERLLDSVDAVIYLLDYTKLKTAEEAAVLARLKDANPLLVRRLSRRLFFAVNKVDQVQQSEGLDEDETREYVADLITRQLSGDGFHLTPEQVMLVSARDALLSRLVLTGRASETASTLFLRNAFGRRWNAKTRSADEVVDAAEEMLEGSGLPELEERVLQFLYTQGGGLKLLATADDIGRLLQEVQNVAVTTEAALAGGVEGLAAKAEGLRGDLQGVLQQLEDLLDKTARLHADVTDEIRVHLQSLRARLFRQIMEALDAQDLPATSTAAAAAASGSPAAAAAAAAMARASSSSSGPQAEGQGVSGAAGGRWARVRQRFASLFGGAAGGAAGGARTADRQQLLAALEQLHDDVINQINTEVRDFWGGLEAVCNARNSALVAAVNRHLLQLAARVEAAVEARFDVKLQAVALKLPEPTPEQFHSDLQELITRGVEERQERHVRVGQREFQERKLRVGRVGLCGWGSYWVTQPVTKTFVETYTSTVYQLQAGEVMRHFIELVDNAVDSSERVLEEYVSTYLGSQLDDARRQIQEYTDRYTSVVTTALEASYQDSDAREAALQHVRARLEAARGLNQLVAGLQEALVGFVPAATGCSGYEEVDYLDYLSDSDDQPPAAVEAPTPPPAPRAATPTLESTALALCDAAPTPPSSEGAPTSSNQYPEAPVALFSEAPPANLPPTPFALQATSPFPAAPLPIIACFTRPTPSPQAAAPTPSDPPAPPLNDTTPSQRSLSISSTVSPNPQDPTPTPSDPPAVAAPPLNTDLPPLQTGCTPPKPPTTSPPGSPTPSSPSHSLYSACSSASDVIHLSASDIIGAQALPATPPRSPTAPSPTPLPIAVPEPTLTPPSDISTDPTTHPITAPAPEPLSTLPLIANRSARATSPQVITPLKFLDGPTITHISPPGTSPTSTPATLSPTAIITNPRANSPNTLQMHPIHPAPAPALPTLQLPLLSPSAPNPSLLSPTAPTSPPLTDYADMMLHPRSPVPSPPAPLIPISTPATLHTPPPSIPSTSTTPTPPSPTAAAPSGSCQEAAPAPAAPTEDDPDVSDYTNICARTEEIPEPPFDYGRGFAQVMSSEALVASADGGASASDVSEDWTVVDAAADVEAQ